MDQEHELGDYPFIITIQFLPATAGWDVSASWRRGIPGGWGRRRMLAAHFSPQDEAIELVLQLVNLLLASQKGQQGFAG